MVSPSAFANFLVCCTHLYESSVGIEWDLICLNESVMDFLRVSSPPFRALRIHRMAGESIFPFQLLSLTSSVRHIHIQPSWHAAPPSEPITHEVYELKIDRLVSQGILSWLLSRTLGSLHLLEVRNTEHYVRTRTFFTAFTPYSSLRIFYNNKLDELINTCTCLDELVLGIYAQMPSTLPPTITHLAIAGHPIATASLLDELPDMIETHPKLRLLTYGDMIGMCIDIPKLEASCAKRNVIIRLGGGDLSSTWFVSLSSIYLSRPSLC
jgi:hypothetical protein